MTSIIMTSDNIRINHFQEAEQFRMNDVMRTPLQIAQDAEIQSQVDARRKLGIVDGRDWTGSLVAPRAERYVQNLPWETPLCDMALLGKMQVAAAYFKFLEDSGVSWGSLVELEVDAARAAETPEQTATRLAAEAKHNAEMEKEVVNYSINRKEDKWTKNGTMTFRVPRPCKYADLFAKRICANCNSHVPEDQTRCKSMKGLLVCNQEFASCWSHTQGTCIYVHPDEPQWADACSGKLCYEREHCACTARGARNCASKCGIVWSPSRFYLAGQERQQVNRFAVAAQRPPMPAPRPAHRPHAGGWQTPSGRSSGNTRDGEWKTTRHN